MPTSTTATGSITLHTRLDGIKSVGDFANFTRYPTSANQGLKIEGHPAFPLPLTHADAEKIKGACKQAPFGKGEDTVVDTSVRNTWELGHTDFQLINPEWPGFLQKVALTAASGLGLLNITVKPHKLLLYEKGSFFKRHKDSEKEPGMVGTLVVCLPSEHQGGDVHLTFGSDQRTFSTAPSSTFDVSALAWFSDVTHEVKELTSGYRLALTYNIIQNGPVKQSAGFFGQQAQQVKQVLLQWQINFSKEKMLVYPLGHKYSESSLSMRNMKGRDKAVCQALQDVASQSGVFLLFAHQTHTQGEDADDYGYGGYDDEEDVAGTSLDAIFTPEGKQIATHIIVDDDENLVPNFFKERAPDSEEEGEFTGNEGAANTYRYHDTVAVLVKKQHLAKFLKNDRYSVGPDAHTDNMVKFVTADLEEHVEHKSTKLSALEFLRAALQIKGGSQKTTPPIAVYWALELDDPALFRGAMVAATQASQETYTEALSVTCVYVEAHFSENPDAIEWDKWLGDTTNSSPLSTFYNSIQHFIPRFKSDAVRDSFSKWSESRLDWKLGTLPELGTIELSFFAKTLESRHDKPDWIMSSLLPALTSRGTRDLIYKVLNTVFVKREQREFKNAKDIYQFIVQNGLVKLLITGEDLAPIKVPYGTSAGIGPLTEFVYRVNEGLSLGATESALQLLEAGCNNLVWTKAEWDPTTVMFNVVKLFLKPLIITLQKHNVPSSHHESIRSLFEVVIGEGLHRQLGPFPPPPVGWSYKPRRCRPAGHPKMFGSHGYQSQCTDCPSLEAFLTAPDQKVWRFSAAEPRRKHVESVLYECTRFFNLSTERGRSPYTLVIEKNGGEYQAEVEQWRTRLRGLESNLAPLRNDLVQTILGEDRYRELILLEGMQGQGTLGNGAGVKREAEEPAFGQPPAAHRRMW
ncbi:hypothetical protein CkaCkLH20_03018 [Colletotrichum karsti]|uniref:Prolyl 4-hydroxylase alpha subunit Fe(2+) 2OG dioxygenase domain-containing protein n=1 Tax=Colletotrichum karsti TaxID=1095194 RepID=A0A9P6IHY5_9PEZI|nr:uncharacterized protein CkaCkLH20_03018 [Colletotrichum karsti]KAF9879475.1 hypothetical protein CkaCkLH20_03018 [Colletotrichum karsti]